jgi:heptaprenylglyceryl phosphate synthase
MINSDKDWIRTQLLAGKTLTQHQVIRDISCWKLASRCSELIAEGYDIMRPKISVGDVTRSRITSYFMTKAAIAKAKGKK